MGVYDRFRYGVALLLVGFAPASVLFWLVVHPLARFWRRVGYRWGYAAGFALSVAAVAASLPFRGAIARTDLGASAVSGVLGAVLLGIAVAMRRRWQRQLTAGTMFGLPELAPEKYPGRLLTEGIYARVRHPRYLQINGIAALMKVIDNKGGVATDKIYNIGNPSTNHSIRDLPDMMMKLAAEYPEYRDSAKKVKIVETTSDAYYGKGYQDVQNRVPKITNTCEDLGWQPTTTMPDTLRKIFDAYRTQIAEARGLID